MTNSKPMKSQEEKASTSFFKTKKEKRLWFFFTITVLTIFASIGFANALSEYLTNEGFIGFTFSLGLLAIAAGIFLTGLRTRPRGVEIGITISVLAVYVIIAARAFSAEHRSHIIEYSVVSLILFEALKERSENKKVLIPAVFAIIGTVLIGTIDELIQFLMPSRVFDLFDIFFDFIASLMAVGASVLLSTARTFFHKRRIPNS